MARSAGTFSPISPRAMRVASLWTTMPTLCIPMKAMKKPMPAEMPILSALGMVLTTISRTRVSVSRMKIAPSMNTAARAICQVTGAPLICIPNTTV